MKQRLVIVMGVAFAMLVGVLGLAGPASAAGDAGISATKLEKNTKKAKKKAKKVCKKAKKLSKSKKATSKAKKSAKKSCAKAKKNSKKLSKKLKYTNAQYFDVCQRGCKYRTVQDGANAAATWQFKNKKRKATVRVQPGTYREGVLLRGKTEKRNFDGLTIMGVTKAKKPNKNARAVILEGKDAKTVLKGNEPNWRPGDATTQPANNAIDAEDIDGLVLKNMWARNYENNTFFVWASNVAEDNSHCSDYVMNNLVSSDTRSYGLFARNCTGGKMINSEGWNHGDSAFYIGETPCDTEAWTNKGPNPGVCQQDPNWTLIDNVKSHQGSLGYSGTNSKYVKISNSDFYNNGAGLVPNTLDSEKFEPSGWLIFENNNIFWNNYNYYSTGSEIETVIGNGNPTGIGIMLYGTDGVIVRDNNIFGNEQWGVGAFSGPELFGVNDGDDAKNMNNQFLNNKMGRNGTDPNGNYDFFTDYSGGGNCWSGNTSSTFAPGNGSVPISTIYPACPQPTVINDDVSSFNFSAGLQVDTTIPDFANEPWRNLETIFGLAEVRPSELQECSWNTSSTHPAFTNEDGESFTQARTDPVSAQACTDLENRPSPWNP